MKNNRVHVFLLIVQFLWLETSQSAQPSAPELKEELSKQERIYRSEGVRTPGGYTINRSLVDYIETLPPEFDRTLAALGPKERWLDIGAGKGQAILDYYDPGYDLTHVEGRDRRGTKAQTVAVSIEDRRTPDWLQKASSLAPNQMQYFFSKPLREYSLDELGQFRVITDVIDDAPFLTEIVAPDGSEVRMCSWLKSIGCVEVACEAKQEWSPPLEVYQMRKTCDKVVVPMLEAIHFQAGTPQSAVFCCATQRIGDPVGYCV